MKPAHTDQVRLVSVDLGLRCGLAFFDEQGQLIRARGTHFPTRSALKEALFGIYRREFPEVTHLICEGDQTLAKYWRALIRREIQFACVSAESWRPHFLTPHECQRGSLAKTRAKVLAAHLIESSIWRPKVALNDDVAEAILLGIWAHQILWPPAPL